MTTIVLNTTNAAVTEYDWNFASLSAHHAADAAGLYALGGNTDAGAPIAASFLTGQQGGGKKLGLGSVYVAVEGTGGGELLVAAPGGSWAYPVTVRASGVSRAKPGRGISENYLALGWRNVFGAAFRVDRIDADIIESPQRSL